MPYAKDQAAALTPEERAVEIDKIDEAVNRFSSEMRTRLKEKLQQGWRGWDDPNNADEIYNSMLAHGAGVPMANGQEIDIANFAMFLWFHRNNKRPEAR